MVAQRGGDAFETFIGFLGEESRRSSGLPAPTLLRTLDGVHKMATSARPPDDSRWLRHTAT